VLPVGGIRLGQVRDEETGTLKATLTSKKLKRYRNETHGTGSSVDRIIPRVRDFVDFSLSTVSTSA